MDLIRILLFLLMAAYPRFSAGSSEQVSNIGSSKSMLYHSFRKPLSFPVLASTVASDPTRFWGSKINKAPYPTNTGWLNFVLNNGTAPEYIHPYTFQLSNGILSFCYPTRFVQPTYIYQTFEASISVSYLEAGPHSHHQVARYDDLTVTLILGTRISVPLVRGSPYVTLIFNNATPVFSTIHKVLKFECNDDRTRYTVMLNNSQTWIVYTSVPLVLGSDLKGTEPFTGVVRFALLPDPLSNRPLAERTLDLHSTAFAIGGKADFSLPFEVNYKWTTHGDGELLLLTLPHHRKIFADDVTRIPELYYSSIDGPLEAIVGDEWVLRVEPLSPGWYSQRGIDHQAKRKIRGSLAADILSLKYVELNETYFAGKVLARTARLGLIAEELGYTYLVNKVRKHLRLNFSPWLDGTVPGNALLYDKKWGGIVSRDGANDTSADFGLGVYNDHHFHYGYFLYAGAVLAKLDSAWATRYKSRLYTLAKDYMTVDREDIHFTRLRHFDQWLLHSWASGLTEFNDGRNQESTTEAINGYYAASLLGLAYSDSEMVNLGLTLAAFEIHTAKALWQVLEDETIYEPEFVKENRVVGIVWSNKRDSSLWFAPAEARQDRLGIQLLPITPITEYVYNSEKYAVELVEWTLPVLNGTDVTDAWRGFVYAVQAVYDPEEALKNILALKEYDEGNSLTNLLWWVYSR